MAHWFGVRLNESTVRVHSVHYTHPWKTAKKKKLITKTRIAEKLRKKKKIIFNSLKYGVLIGGNGVSVIIFFPNRANFATITTITTITRSCIRRGIFYTLLPLSIIQWVRNALNPARDYLDARKCVKREEYKKKNYSISSNFITRYWRFPYDFHSVRFYIVQRGFTYYIGYVKTLILRQTNAFVFPTFIGA